MKYKTEEEILDIIEKFETCSIDRGTWGHPEHLILACHYASNNNFETALNKMRDGIFKLLKSFEIDLTSEMPYHETLTVFWMQTIYNYVRSTDGGHIVKNIDKMIRKFDKNYPSRFYSHARLFSDEARKAFIVPDLQKTELLLLQP